MTIRSIVLTAALAAAGAACAAVSPEEAKELGKTLTPWGSEVAGNRDGSIPAYSGSLKGDPVATEPEKGSGRPTDPYANEKPLVTITANNMDQYADNLSEATKELLRRYPNSFRVDVYPTHRRTAYSRFFVENSEKNATRCSLDEGGLAVKGCFGGIPFPIPKSGIEVMWNILLAPNAPGLLVTEGVYVDANGAPVESALQETYTAKPYNDERLTLEQWEADGQRSSQSSALQLAPARIAGDGTLTRYTANPVKNRNLGYAYQQGNRRVRAIPEAQYDFPTLVSGGALFFDELNIFTGKLDKFDYKLIGKKEMFIPYNDYRGVFAPTDKMVSVGGGHHPNPDCIRWERHRVWVVEATLKEGMRHAAVKRRYYIDEDYPAGGMTDSWDRSGKIFKGVFAQIYEPGRQIASHVISYDLSTGIYYLSAQMGSPRTSAKVIKDIPASVFTPEGLARRSTR